MYDQIKQQAEQARKNKDYANAINSYKELCTNYRNDCTEWDGWGYAFCLKQVKEYKKALNICREVYKLNPNFEHNKNLYAWCIYYTEIGIEKINNEDNFFKAGEAIIKLVKQEDKSVKLEKNIPCLYSLSVFKILDYLNEKAIYNPKPILYWTEKLNPDFLENIPFQIIGNDGKQRELAPHKEKWYSLRSKALLENKQFGECIKLSEKAIMVFNKFHYDNDIWFKRNIAHSKAELGDYVTAIEELKLLLKRKNEWFIQKEIAELYIKQNDIDTAMNFAVDAALNFGDADKKMNLYTLLADLLATQNKIEEAKLHIELIYQIRNSNQWKIPSELLDRINKYQIDTNNLSDIKDITRKLKPIWEQLKFGTQELLKGIIKTIIAEGKAGFIETDNKKFYFFSAKDFKGRRDLMQQGQKVTFFLEDGFDKKKNQPTKIAVNIRNNTLNPLSELKVLNKIDLNKVVIDLAKKPLTRMEKKEKYREMERQKRAVN
jgi:predicted Zn-dependent protease/cold shock CspA family protein